MKQTTQKRLRRSLTALAATVAISAGTLMLTSFNSGSGGSGGGGFWETDPPTDCSYTQLVYNSGGSSGSAGGSISGSGGPTGGSGSISGSGSSGSWYNGYLGYFWHHKQKVGCSLTFWGSCNERPCYYVEPPVWHPA